MAADFQSIRTHPAPTGTHTPAVASQAPSSSRCVVEEERGTLPVSMLHEQFLVRAGGVKLLIGWWNGAWDSAPRRLDDWLVGGR